MRLLVTRPLQDASRTAEKLRASGHEVLVQALLAIVFSPPPVDLPEPAAILVTSQNGLRALARWPQAAGWRGTPLFAAGPATLRAAEALGFRDVRGGASDAGSLADGVLAALPNGAGSLIYPAARDRAGALVVKLSARGYDVRAIEAYRAEVAPRLDEKVRDALVAGRLDGVLLYSRRTATAFRDLAAAAGVGDHLAGLAYYVISDEVAAVLSGIPARFHVANRPDEDGLLALIPPAE